MSLLSCKDYDDDIDSLQSQIDKITMGTGSLADLKTQLEALKTASATAERVTQLEAELRALIASEKAALESAYKAKDLELQNLINGKASQGDLDDLSSQVTQALSDLAGIQARLDEIDGAEGALKQLQDLVTTKETELKELISTLEGKVDGKVDAATYGQYTQKTDAAINKLTTDLAALQGELAKVDGTIDTKVAKAKEELKDEIEEAVKDMFTQTAFNNWLSTTYQPFYNEYTKFAKDYNSLNLNGRIKALETWKTQNAANVAKIANLESQLNTLQDNWETDNATLTQLKSAFDTHIANFQTTISDAIAEAIENGLQEDGAIKKAIDDATSTLSNEIDDLTSRIEDLETWQEKAKSQIAALIKRIQSLVFVPTHEDMKIHLGGDFVAPEGETEVGQNGFALSENNATVKYRVSPASLAAELVDAEWSFYAQEVTKAGDGPKFEVVGKPKTVDGEEGVLEFNVTTDYGFAGKGLAVALCVKSKSAAPEEEGDKVYTEYTSAYTPATLQGTNVIGNFVFAKKAEDGTYTEYAKGGETGNLGYRQTDEPYTFFKDYEVCYKDGTLKSLEDAATEKGWTITPVFGFTPDEPIATDLVADTYEFDPAANTFTLTVANAQNVDKKATDKIKVYVANSAEAGAKQVGLPEANSPEEDDNAGKYLSTVTITKEKRTLNIKGTLVWNYTTWSTQGDYEITKAVLTDGEGNPVTDLSSDELGYIAQATASAEGPTIGETLQNFGSDITVTLGEAGEPAEDDQQTVKVTVTNYAYGSGTITGKYTYAARNAESLDLDINVTITVEAPADRTIDVTNEDLKVTAINTDYLLYAALTAEEKPETLTVPTNTFYSADEVTKFFGGNYTDATAFVLNATGDKLTLTSTTEGNEGELKADNPQSDTWSTVNGDVATQLGTAGPEVLMANFTAVDLTNGDVTFTAAGKLVIANGPEFPISGDITIKKPADANFKFYSRLSGSDGLESKLHDVDYGADHVLLKGEHEQGTHNYIYETANLLDAIGAEKPEAYSVEFEVTTKPEDVNGETFPTVDKESTPGQALMKLANDYSNKTKDDQEKYKYANYVELEAKLTNEGGIVYNTKSFRVVAEIPFENPVQKADAENTFKVYENTPLEKQLGELLSMKNLVPASDEGDEMFVDGVIDTNIEGKDCYNLSIEWDTKLEWTTADAGFSFEGTLGADGTFKFPKNSAMMAHKYDVTAKYTVKGNFGYEYKGEVKFSVVPGK